MLSSYYDQDGITIYHGDCRDVLPSVAGDILVTDPPYGISYESSRTGHDSGTSLPGIVGDEDTGLRDWVLRNWDGPAVVFGTWKVEKPDNVKSVLIWEKGDHVGMGDLSMPWKPNTEEVYVIGSGFRGHRGSSVLRVNAAVTWNSISGGRKHPHEKPAALMRELIAKCPPGRVVDPFAGSGATLEAARMLGREAVGIEIEEQYCEIAVKRLQQKTLPFAG